MIIFERARVMRDGNTPHVMRREPFTIGTGLASLFAGAGEAAAGAAAAEGAAAAGAAGAGGAALAPSLGTIAATGTAGAAIYGAKATADAADAASKLGSTTPPDPRETATAPSIGDPRAEEERRRRVFDRKSANGRDSTNLVPSRGSAPYTNTILGA